MKVDQGLLLQLPRTQHHVATDPWSPKGWRVILMAFFTLSLIAIRNRINACIVFPLKAPSYGAYRSEIH